MYHTSGISALTSRSRAQAASLPAGPRLDPAVHTFSTYLFSHNEKRLSRKVRLMSSRLRRQDALITSLRAQLAHHSSSSSETQPLRIQDEHGEDDEEEEEEERDEEQEEAEQQQQQQLGDCHEEEQEHWEEDAGEWAQGRDDDVAQARQLEGEAGSIRDAVIAELRQVQAERQALRNLSNLLLPLPLPPSAFTSPLSKQASTLSDLLQAAQQQQQQQEGETSPASAPGEQEETGTEALDDALDLQSLEAETGQEVESGGEEGAEGQPGSVGDQTAAASPASPASSASASSCFLTHKRRRSRDSEAADEDDGNIDSISSAWKRVKDETAPAPIADVAVAVQQQAVVQCVAQPEPFRPLHAFPSALVSLPAAGLSSKLLTPYRALSARIDRQSIALLAASPMRFAIPQL